jgi:hypothetical protein
MAEDDARNPNGTWKRGQPADRETSKALTFISQIDAAEESLALRGIGRSATRELMGRCAGLTRERANWLLRLVQKRWEQERKMTTRTMRKNLIRYRLEQVHRLALEKQRAIVVQSGRDEQKVEHVDDADLKAAAVALNMLIDLDGLRGELEDEANKTPESAMQAARRAFAEAYGAPLLEPENEKPKE